MTVGCSHILMLSSRTIAGPVDTDDADIRHERLFDIRAGAEIDLQHDGNLWFLNSSISASPSALAIPGNPLPAGCSVSMQDKRRYYAGNF